MQNNFTLQNGTVVNIRGVAARRFLDKVRDIAKSVNGPDCEIDEAEVLSSACSLERMIKKMPKAVG